MYMSPFVMVDHILHEIVHNSETGMQGHHAQCKEVDAFDLYSTE